MNETSNVQLTAIKYFLFSSNTTEVFPGDRLPYRICGKNSLISRNVAISEKHASVKQRPK